MPRIIILHDPLDARGHNDLGVAYQQRGEHDLAIREYDRAAELKPGWARPLINRGNTHAECGQWRQAEKSYRLALRRESGNAEAMNNLAWVLLQVRSTSEAQEWSEKAVRINPGEPAYLDTLAEVRIAQQDHKGAGDAVRAALALAPTGELREKLEQKRELLDSFR